MRAALLVLLMAAGEWQADLTVLKAELQRIHPRFRTCGLPAELDSQFAQLSGRLDSLTDSQIAVEVQRLLASVGDGHTLLWPFGMKRGTLLRAPVTLWWFEEGVYVVDGKHAGRRVVRIGTLPAEEVLLRLKPYISQDNDMQSRWAAPFYATLSDFLMAIGAATDRIDRCRGKRGDLAVLQGQARAQACASKAGRSVERGCRLRERSRDERRDSPPAARGQESRDRRSAPEQRRRGAESG
jgi:hypothetical protein